MLTTFGEDVMRRTGTIALVLLAAACGSGGEAAELPGDYGQLIAETDDCGELQDIFDTAETSDMDGRVEVMEAADGRMAEAGCY